MPVMRWVRNLSPNSLSRIEWESSACTPAWMIDAAFSVAFIGVAVFGIVARIWLLVPLGLILLKLDSRKLCREALVWYQATPFRQAKRQLLRRVAQYRNADRLVLASATYVLVIQTHQVRRVPYLQIVVAEMSDVVSSVDSNAPIPVTSYQISRKLRIPIQCGRTVMARSRTPGAWPGDMDIQATRIATLDPAQRRELLAGFSTFADQEDCATLQRQLKHAAPYEAALGI